MVDDCVDVVRCRYCKYSRQPNRHDRHECVACEGVLVCCVGFDHVFPSYDDGLIFVDEDFYCKEGKERDDEND